ncbi:MAG TPA: carboxylating nicotinate-nucleotide diphosphorylase [Phycisphaerae bacterium]|nr:carboxylating nicotinate-nucleotide diphosphorylase [Phycisphaerae bacterium]
MHESIDREYLCDLWHRALAEDGADDDVTCAVALQEKALGTAHLDSRQVGVFAGRFLLNMLDELYAGPLKVDIHVEDGGSLSAGTRIATLVGSLRLLLGLERTLLNFLERLCGVATLTRGFVDAVAGTKAKIYDTRKTLPGWRKLDKYAVRCGGGCNHRMGLHDAILVKDNHIAGIPTSELAAVAGEIIRRRDRLAFAPDFVEFEVDTLEQFDELLKVGGIDVILLDNFTPDQMREAVRRRGAAGLAGKLLLEASGGVSLDKVRVIAETGVERIAVGALTHSAPALDIGMEIDNA